VLVSILSGIASGWWFARKNTYRVMVIDVKGIVEDKKKELLERYKKNPTDETVKEVDKELAEFLRRLDYKISSSGDSQRLVMLKDAVLAGETADITDEVKKYANQR
jgi:Skp family chaperone for outer membrane proteins